jgi:metal-sulfur cluster biosynthetic enzyme
MGWAAQCGGRTAILGEHGAVGAAGKSAKRHGRAGAAERINRVRRNLVVTQEQVMEALRQVMDPELGINIVDLGLVYRVEIQDSRIHVAMTMTTRACPLHTYMTENANAVIHQLAPDAQSVDIEMVWDPPWSPEMMSDAAKQQLGWKH